MKETNGKRTLASQPFSFNAYEDNYGAVMALCEASGRKPAEELRDLLDEGISARMKRNGEGIEVSTTETGQQMQREGEIAQLVQVLQQLVQKTTLQQRHDDADRASPARAIWNGAGIRRGGLRGSTPDLEICRRRDAA